MYTYRAILARVIDGDTVDVETDFGFFLRQRMRLRLAGVNTPELRGPEREAGKAARAFVRVRLEAADRLVIRTTKKGKYGRFVADLWYGDDTIPWEEMTARGTNLNAELLAEGQAVEIGR